MYDTDKVSTCGIYRLGEHCKIIVKRLQNHVKYSAVQTIHAHHQTSYQDLKLSISSFAPIGWFYGLITERPCMLMHRPRKHELSLACACSVPITHSSTDYESQPNEPQQRSELATQRGRPQNSPITQFFLLKLYFKIRAWWTHAQLQRATLSQAAPD